MKSYISQTVLRAVQRLADAPEQTLSLVAARFGTELELDAVPTPAPDHLMVQLEGVFEALSELPFQPDVSAALNLACDALQAELPSGAVAAGLYDINADEIRIVTARGMEHDLLRGLIMTRDRCFVGRAADAPFVLSSEPGGADWLGSGDEGAQALLCPIACDGHLLGVLAVADPTCIDRFSDHDMELVSYVAGQLASFIQALRQRPSIPAPALARRA
jgi:GAF domain-containing protein